MKTIYLVRHAKAVSRATDLPDFDRRLLPRGKKVSAQMAERLKKQEIIPELFISSPALRALETARVFAKTLKYPKKEIVKEQGLNNEFGPEEFLQLIRTLDNERNAVIVFGHEPMISAYAGYLLKSFHESVPKTAVIGIEFGNKTWKNIQPGRGKLILFDYPGKKAKELKNLRAELQARLTDRVFELFSQTDKTIADLLKPDIETASKQLAAKFVKKLKKQNAS